MKTSNILLYGGACVGKSFSLATLFKLQSVRPHQRVFFLSTERNSLSGLERGLEFYNINLQLNQLIFAHIKSKAKKAFAAEVNALKAFASQTIESTYSIDKKTNANKDKYTFFIEVCKGLESFKGIDFVTKEEVSGLNITEFEPEDILVIDGLTPIVHGIWSLLQGDRKINHQNDYQIVQKQVKDFVNELVTSIDCSLILLAHEEYDENKTLRPAINCGQKLHGSFVGNFTDCIYAYKTMAGKYCWAGKKLNVETATRNFPYADTLEPDFSIYNFFREDGKN